MAITLLKYLCKLLLSLLLIVISLITMAFGFEDLDNLLVELVLCFVGGGMLGASIACFVYLLDNKEY